MNCSSGTTAAIAAGIFSFVMVSTAMSEDKPAIKSHSQPYPSFGKIERKDARFDKLIAPDAKLEKLAEGFAWSEGPLWMKDGGYLLFNDIPPNKTMKWKAGEGITLFMQPSGYSGVDDYGAEPGANGLALDPQGRIVFCEHGDRRVSVLTKGGGKMTLVDKYNGKRLNSPNDVVFKSNGDMYFTDPPYGLPKRWEDPMREQEFCGVYRLRKTVVDVATPVPGNAKTFRRTESKPAPDELTLLTSEMTRPNGLAFSPDEKILYVAQSDPDKAIWMAFDVKPDGTLSGGRQFFDSTPWVKEKRPGLPDGLKVDAAGNLFATGPGGVHVFAPDGTLLGSINTGERTANCAWGEDGTVLYVTAHMYLGRIQTTTKGSGW